MFVQVVPTIHAAAALQTAVDFVVKPSTAFACPTGKAATAAEHALSVLQTVDTVVNDIPRPDISVVTSRHLPALPAISGQSVATGEVAGKPAHGFITGAAAMPVRAGVGAGVGLVVGSGVGVGSAAGAAVWEAFAAQDQAPHSAAFFVKAGAPQG